MPVVLGGGLALAIGVGIFMLLPEPEIATVAETADVQEVVTSVPTAVVQAPVAPVEPATPMSPEFDTFRVETDGTMVVAGRAEPGQVVDIILAGVAIDRVTADAAGNFVSLPTAGPSDKPRRLSLLADPEGRATGSVSSFLLAPIAAPLVVADVGGTDDDGADDSTLVEGGTQTAQADTATPTAPTFPEEEVAFVNAPPTVLQADEDGVRVVQGGPSLDAPQEANVALDAITYDPDGEVQLSGRATGDGAVQIYIDNEPVTTSVVTKGGDWQINLPQIDTGVYTLRIDEVDTAGDVVSRLETPFKREEAADVAAVLAEETSVDGFEVAVKTVQPGATLWAIAKENLGSGILYVAVFEANRDLIRDPDLIYPGQIFRIPEVNQ